MRPIVQATLVAGTLDILAATGLTLNYGKRSVADMLRFVASGPFPASPSWGTSGVMLGLIVHFGLMAIMVAVFVRAARQWPAIAAQPLLWGVAYGLITYVVMNLIVVPVRFRTPLPPSTAAIISQLFCHIVLVGIPVALITAQAFRARPT